MLKSRRVLQITAQSWHAQSDSSSHMLPSWEHKESFRVGGCVPHNVWDQSPDRTKINEDVFFTNKKTERKVFYVVFFSCQ